MKKLYLLLLFTCWAHLGFAQRSGTIKTQAALPGGGTTALPPSRWKEHADSIFRYLDRSPVGTGLLTNYGFALKNYNLFQGTDLVEGNLLQNLGEWRLLYAAMQTSTFNANATLPSLRTANQRISQVQQQAPNVVSIATLLVRYDRFRDDAGTAGLVTVSNQQLYDAPNRPRSPYEQRTLVTLSPLTSKVATRSPQFSFPSTLRFTNAAPTITALEFDAGEGQGYRAAVWDQPLTATYPADGTYTLRFRLSCADGSVLLSQARLDVKQPPAARYQPTGSPNVVTRNSSELFTDTRPYGASNGISFSNYAATGTVTVAFANGNTTGTIRKPLIVIEGYDPSKVLRANGVNTVPDYNYNSFAFGQTFGGIFTDYTIRSAGDRFIFNDQLHEVGQYDLIFLNFENGTDYIQRNAYLVERLIQWVNDTKQPLNGVRQQNIVMGMSMGGLVARYALRDMEMRQAAGQATFSHDAKLYVSHEAPHQGANVPLGVQYAVSGLANMSVVGVLSGADLSPELGAFAKLLNEPATQQLLLYQTTASGANLHNTWLNEYNNTLGYPTQCRNIATSGGSECGRPQGFAPYAELLNIQGSGLLDEPLNGFANAGLLGAGMLAGVALSTMLGPAALFAGFAAGYIMALGNFEGQADFVVNALPSQQVQRIYHGKFTICKEILFGLFTTCLVDYSENRDSESFMLAYDSAPGGIYDIDQVSGGIVSQIGTALPIPIARVYVQPQFCFIPTTSALDIGGGSVALGPQNLTASYTSTALPAAPFNTPFANFVTASRENLTHILWNGLNSKWVFQEMQGAPQVFNCQTFCQFTPAMTGAAVVCQGGTTYTVNAPVGSVVDWLVTPSGLTTPASQTGGGSSFTLYPLTTSSSGTVTVTATIRSECGQVAVPPLTVRVGFDQISLEVSPTRVEVTERYTVTSSSFGPLTNRQWRRNGTLLSSTAAEILLRAPSSGGTDYISLTGTDVCGSSVTGNIAVAIIDPYAYQYSVYPNPADETTTVAADVPPGPAGAGLARSFQATLHNAQGQPVQTQPSRNGAAPFDTRALPAGLYHLVIREGQHTERRNVSIQH